jgi:hypothetical protein
MNAPRAVCILVLTSMLFVGSVSRCQEVSTTQTPAEPKPMESAVTPYHAEFVLNELENGKKINVRHFSMDLTGGSIKQAMKIGARVPVEVKQGELQYLDVGFNIDCRLTERQNGLGLEISGDVSSMAAHSAPPLIRQFRVQSTTVVLPGKPAMIASGDDPDSDHQFQLEVTVTKINQ